MKRTGDCKYPNSVQLFDFCQKIFLHQKATKKIHDQEIGAILNFNPSDCSHWKKGEKNIKSIFSLKKLSDRLNIDTMSLYEIANGSIDAEEAFFEYSEIKKYNENLKEIQKLPKETKNKIKKEVLEVLHKILHGIALKTPPIYLPEFMSLFPFIKLKPAEHMGKLSRILKTKPGSYIIHHRKGSVSPQTRLSVITDITRIMTEVEKNKYPELGQTSKEIIIYYQMLLTSNLLVPTKELSEQIKKIAPKKELIEELANIFSVPRFIINFQIMDLTQEKFENQTSTNKRFSTHEKSAKEFDIV